MSAMIKKPMDVLLAAALAAIVVSLAAITRSTIPAGAVAVAPVYLALGRGVRGTALASAGALLTALVAGLAAGDFGEAAHWAALVAVAVAGAGAMVVSAELSLRTRELERSSYLAEATALLSSSVDYDTTVRAAAALPVPRLAGWCVLDLAEPGGTVDRRAALHRDSELEELTWRLGSGYEEPLEHGPGEALHAARTELWTEVPDSLLAALARDERHLSGLRAVGATSAIIAPLRTVDRTLGVMTLGSDRERQFSREDVALAQDLARRCAVAIANAELYRDAMQSRGGRFAREQQKEDPAPPPERGAS